jgi:hypothetical protein
MDYAYECQWPGDEAVAAHRGLVAGLNPTIAADIRPHELASVTNGSGVVYAMALGDWGPTTWGFRPGQISMKDVCKNESTIWGAATMACMKLPVGKDDCLTRLATEKPYPPECLSSQHNKCGVEAYGWRTANEFNVQRCTGSSPLWQREEDAQKNVAAEMKKVIDAGRDPEFVLSVGDNFYWAGVVNEYDGRFRDVFENVYEFNAPFLSCLGNHDYGGEQCDKMFRLEGKEPGAADTAAQITYDKDHDWVNTTDPKVKRKNGRWTMPARYFKKGFRFAEQGVSIDVFIVDTNFASSGKICRMVKCVIRPRAINTSMICNKSGGHGLRPN